MFIPVVHVYSRRLETIDSGHAPTTSSLEDPATIHASTSNLDLTFALRKSKHTCTYPISSFMHYNHLSSSSRYFITTLESVTVPITFKEALCHPSWRVAMQEEMVALDDNGT